MGVRMPLGNQEQVRRAIARVTREFHADAEMCPRRHRALLAGMTALLRSFDAAEPRPPIRVETPAEQEPVVVEIWSAKGVDDRRYPARPPAGAEVPDVPAERVSVLERQVMGLTAALADDG